MCNNKIQRRKVGYNVTVFDQKKARNEIRMATLVSWKSNSEPKLDLSYQHFGKIKWPEMKSLKVRSNERPLSEELDSKCINQ